LPPDRIWKGLGISSLGNLFVTTAKPGTGTPNASFSATNSACGTCFGKSVVNGELNGSKVNLHCQPRYALLDGYQGSVVIAAHPGRYGLSRVQGNVQGNPERPTRPAARGFAEAGRGGRSSGAEMRVKTLDLKKGWMRTIKISKRRWPSCSRKSPSTRQITADPHLPGYFAGRGDGTRGCTFRRRFQTLPGVRSCVTGDRGVLKRNPRFL